MSKRKNEAQVDIDVFNALSNDLSFSSSWETQKTSDKNIQSILDNSSKKGTGNHGYPDLIYVNQSKRFLVLIENKPDTISHESPNRDCPQNFAIDGVIHYLSFFTTDNINEQSTSVKNYLEDWNIVGVAFSGNIKDEYNHIISTFLVTGNDVVEQDIGEFLNEEDYLSLFENIDLDLISNNISKSSREINRLLRGIDSQKRPVLLSALMICLYDKEGVQNDFKTSYQKWQASTIITNIPSTIGKILISEGIPQDKVDVLVNELSFTKTDNDLNATTVLKDILYELENNVIPLFNKKSSYDILGKFYEEFLRFAGVSNVKKGIVLTPSHVTNLFTKLIDLKINDVILDPCCGSGSFLIAGMNKLISTISDSSVSNKQKRIKTIKETQLIGFENSSTMYSLAISNMLFRGDGKSKIYNIDFFGEQASKYLEEAQPTIGFMNPPFGGSDNDKNPTKKEIQFLELMLDNVSRYGIVIAPVSTFFKENGIRNRILSKHTLKCVINMPVELFQPNASTITSIAIFETNLPHNSKDVIFYDLKDDGLVLSKHKGRIDRYTKWPLIEKDLLLKLREPDSHRDNYSLVKCPINNNDEWLIQAHSDTDYSIITDSTFLSSIKRHVVFSFKSRLKLLNVDVDEISMMEMLFDKIKKKPVITNTMELSQTNFKPFKFGGEDGVFSIYGGYYNKKPEHIVEGDIPFIGASKENNGVTEYYSLTDIENNQKDTGSKFHELDKKMFKSNCITVANNGSAGSAFYQEQDFTCSHDVNVLYLKNKEINIYIAIFLRALIELEKFRWDFGRKWRPIRMPQSIIRLPVDKRGKPDWQFMEDYIKSLPYSSNL